VRVVRGRGEARWLPSRHRFALFRLYAFLRLRRAKPEPAEAMILVVDRDQTAFEHYGISIWILVMVTCYFAAVLPWPLALPLALIAIEVLICAAGILVRRGPRGNAFVISLLLAIASAYFAMQQSWVRFVAWQFFALVALNAFAAAIVFLLREPIARLERGVLSER
jgi:hypothetical protein